MKQTDIRDFLSEAQGERGLWQQKEHKEKIGTCLKHFAAKGIPLSVCHDERHLNRAVSTLQRYAREFGLKFPDYVPMALREKRPARERISTDSPFAKLCAIWDLANEAEDRNASLSFHAGAAKRELGLLRSAGDPEPEWYLTNKDYLKGRGWS